MSRNWVFRPTLNSMQTGVVARSERPRDAGIDAAVLSVTLRHLAESGLSALSVAAIAQEAGTTRPAIYRAGRPNFSWLSPRLPVSRRSRRRSPLTTRTPI